MDFRFEIEKGQFHSMCYMPLIICIVCLSKLSHCSNEVRQWIWKTSITSLSSLPRNEGHHMPVQVCVCSKWKVNWQFFLLLSQYTFGTEIDSFRHFIMQFFFSFQKFFTKFIFLYILWCVNTLLDYAIFFLFVDFAL